MIAIEAPGEVETLALCTGITALTNWFFSGRCTSAKPDRFLTATPG